MIKFPDLQALTMNHVKAILVFGLLLWLDVPANAAEPSHYERILIEKNIQATADGINSYLDSLHPGAKQRLRAAALIKGLGNADSFATREASMAKLLVLPVLPSESLIAASKGPDPEIRWRAKHVLKLGKPESEKVLYAAFRTIGQKRITGVTVELLRAISLCDKSHLKFAARQALVAIARPQDAGALRRAMKSKQLEVRVAATSALGEALGKKAAADLNALLDDPQDRIRLAAARGLANYGDRRSLTTLAAILASEDLRVRVYASSALRYLSGKHFGFAAYDSPKKRAAAIVNWNRWIAGEGRTAKLKFPLKSSLTQSHLGGNTLLAFGYQNKVVEYDPSGKEVRSYTARGAWSAEKLASGNVLIAANSQGQVFEADPLGKVVWEYKTPNPLNAKPLPNGNVLIAGYGSGRALEVDRTKKIVWQYAMQNCADVHRLEGGNTLMIGSQGAREVTPEGKVVWQYPLNGQFYGIQPLRNGNVLICDFSRNRVIEVTRDKTIVWEMKAQNPTDAFRLPNGNTLITGNTNFIEVTPDKKTIWTKGGCNYGSARR